MALPLKIQTLQSQAWTLKAKIGAAGESHPQHATLVELQKQVDAGIAAHVRRVNNRNLRQAAADLARVGAA